MWKRSNESDKPTRKRKHDAIEMDQPNDDDVDVEAIEGSVKKKQKLTKDERADLLRVSSAYTRVSDPFLGFFIVHIRL